MTLSDGKFVPCVDTTAQRSVLSCIGPSGSGKSYFSKAYIKDYQEKYPKNEKFLLSTVDDDSSLKDVKLKRVIIDEEMIHDPLDLKDFGKNCLILMDDIDTIRNKDIKASIDNLKDQILETGRHTHTTLILTSHLATKGRETKTMLNESSMITIYLNSGTNYSTLLENYLGLKSKQIQKLKNIKSRFVCFIRCYPMIAFTERSVFFLADL